MVIVESGDFCIISTNRLKDETGLSEGDVVGVVGDVMVPVEEDPYIYRKQFAICSYVDGKFDSQVFIVDGTALTPVSQDVQESYEKILREKYPVQ